MADIENFFKNKKSEVVVKAEESRQENGGSKGLGYFISAVATLVFLGLGVSAVYYYGQYRKAINTAGTGGVDEAEEIQGKIKKFMDLPEEKPTLATVADKEKLKDQYFFSKAENGDKVLVYLEAKKALLWRPSVSKVIEVTNLVDNSANAQKKEDVSADSPDPDQLSEDNQENNSTETITQEATVAVFNGTKIKGLAADMAEKIADISGVKIVSKVNAKKDYTKNIVVDLTGGHEKVAQEIVDKLGGAVGELPEGEVKPEADILVIGGNNL